LSAAQVMHAGGVECGLGSLAAHANERMLASKDARTTRATQADAAAADAAPAPEQKVRAPKEKKEKPAKEKKEKPAGQAGGCGKHACVRARMHAYVSACAHSCMHVSARARCTLPYTYMSCAPYLSVCATHQSGGCRS